MKRMPLCAIFLAAIALAPMTSYACKMTDLHYSSVAAKAAIDRHLENSWSTSKGNLRLTKVRLLGGDMVVLELQDPQGRCSAAKFEITIAPSCEGTAEQVVEDLECER